MAAVTPIITRAVFFEATFEAGAEVAVSPRPFSSLTIRESGRISVTAEGRTFFSEPGSLTFIPRGCGYTTQVLEPGKMRILHFDIPPDGVDFSEKPLVARPPSPLAFQNTFGNAIAHYAASGCDCAVMSAAYELLAEANRVFRHTAPPPPPRMIRAREYLDEHICDPSLRVGELAAGAGISEVYFRKEFQRCYGASPLSYIKKRRIDLAKRLLSTGLYTVTEVALQAGFDSISYFSAEFRRLVGTTPANYRKKYDQKF